MGRAPLWCHARCAAFALALALACLSGARALSSDVLAVGDVPSANVQKRFPVVGRPRTFPPGPTVTGAVRLGTVRERAFPSRADAAGVPGTDADAFPVDANGPAAREDARGWAEAVVEDVARAGEGAGDAPAKTEDAEDAEDAEDVCLTPRRFETEEIDLASAVTAMAPALVAALAVSASAALALRAAAAAAARSAAAAAAFAASSASAARRCLGGVARGRFGRFGKNAIALFTRAFARTELEPGTEPATARPLRSRAAPLAPRARRRAPFRDESLLSPPAVRAAARRGGEQASRAREQASPVTRCIRRLRERKSSSEDERFGSATVADGDADGGRRLASSRAAFSAANTPPPRRSTRLRKAANASPTSHFEGIESGATSGSSADESPAFDSEEDREERPRETWREQMTDIFRAVGHRR